MRKNFVGRLMRCDYDYVQWQVLQTIKNSFTFLPLILLLFSHTATVGQQCGNEEPIASLYVSLEEMPQYPDGEKGLLDFLNENLKISSGKRVRAVDFVVAGVVNISGKFENVAIIQGATGINDDIVHVCELLRFTPGKQNGKIVEVLYSFSLHITYGGYITDFSSDIGISERELWDMYFDAIDPYYRNGPRINSVPDDELIYFKAEKMPLYKGSFNYHYVINEIAENFECKMDKTINRNIVIQFIVNEEGQAVKPIVIKGVSPLYDTCFCNGLLNLGAWEPGEIDGRKVKVCITLPIMIRNGLPCKYVEGKLVPIKSNGLKLLKKRQ
jgi:protein TonB